MVSQGSSVTVAVTVPPLGGSFNNVVTLSASGLPPGASATFIPATVTPGSAGAPTVLTIQLLTATTAGVPADPQRRIPFAPLSAAIVLCCAAFAYRHSTPRSIKRAFVFMSFVLVGSVLAGCNGGFAGKPGTLPGNYTITITGTSGSQQRSTTITLIVP
jgi:trimeric autotransporter adhesin